MKHFYCCILFLPVIFLLTACSGRSSCVSPEGLVKYVTEESNGLHKAIEVNGTKIDITFRPTDLWVQQELGDDASDSARVDALRSKYHKYYYFILSLSRNEREALHAGNDFLQYSDLVQTMSFRMTDYVTLTTSASDTIPVGDFMLNRTYGLSSTTDIIFAFNKERAIDTEWVQFNLNEFGLGAGNQRFRFRSKDIENAPRIYY